MEIITVSTEKGQQIVDITDEVRKVVAKSKAKEGLCCVYTPHATCAVMVNENWDPNIMIDIIDSLNSLVPEGKWKHDKVDNNGAAHIKASIIGPSEIVPISNGDLLLGEWQDIMLADFNGPRERRVIVDIIKK